MFGYVTFNVKYVLHLESNMYFIKNRVIGSIQIVTAKWGGHHVSFPPRRFVKYTVFSTKTIDKCLMKVPVTQFSSDTPSS